MSDTTLVRGRDGDLYTATSHIGCVCDGSGWAGENHRGAPIPCYACKPHLSGRIGPGRRRVHTPIN